MALNAAQQARRLQYLGSSDVACLMQGDKERIHQLWLVKTGQAPPDDLSGVWPVQLGVCTEQLNLNWYEFKNQHQVNRRGDVVRHPFYSMFACMLDGWIEELQCPIEAKHVGGHEPTYPVVVDRYQPQCQWLMEITGADECALSIIAAAREPVVEFIERDKDYATILIERGQQFWQHVVDRTPPVDLPAVPAPVDANREIDMTGNNQWADTASRWLETKEAAQLHDDSKVILKSMVPAEAKKAFGHGVMISRDRRGVLSLREQT
jgi:predicted phage-related endonuclease